MAAVVLLSQLDAPHVGADFAALEAAAHGRARDASRGEERWLGVALTVRTARPSKHARWAEGTTLAHVLATRLVEAGEAGAVVSGVADAAAALVAVARRTPRVVLVGTPCDIFAARAAGEVPGLERVLTIGVPTVHDAVFAPKAADHACPGCGDRVNALADIVVGAFDDAPQPWVVVRNATGRAMLDALEHDIVCDAVDAPGRSARLAAVRSRMSAPMPAHPARPEVMP
jgi:hypothetical protein